MSGEIKTIPEIASRVLRRTRDPKLGLKELVIEIKDAIQAIDPTVTRVMSVFDWDANGNERLRCIMIDRKDAPIVTRCNPAEGGGHSHGQG